jgi:hypothetical protein
VLVLPLEFGDAGFLGDFSQLAPGFLTLLLEAKGVALVVGLKDRLGDQREGE